VGPKVPCKDVERKLTSEREGEEEEEERCNLDLISHPCPIHGSTSTSTYGRMRGLRKGCALPRKRSLLILPCLGLGEINWKTDKNRFKPS